MCHKFNIKIEFSSCLIMCLINSQRSIRETTQNANINIKGTHEKDTKPMIYLNNSLRHFLVKTKNYIRDKSFLSEDYEICANCIFLSDKPGEGTVSRG